MAIFGVSGSKFVTINGSTTVNLDHSVLKETNYQLSKELEHTSIINGDSNWITLGDKSAFTVTVHLHKYSDPKTAFLNIYTHNHTNVYFYPHREGNAIKDSYGFNVPFHISDIVLYHIGTVNEYDVCDIKFESAKYTNLSASLA